MTRPAAHRLFGRAIAAAILTCALAAGAASQPQSAPPEQRADPNFKSHVAHPLYVTSHPKLLFDEGHNNFHTADGRYKPFADLARNDGYALTPSKAPFTAASLAGYDLLVIANARGPGTGPESFGGSAFTEEETQAVAEWVRGGGALLLIADHAPFGSAAESLARRFGVDMGKGYALDPKDADPETGNPSFILFSRQNHLLGDHPITTGRAASERIGRILSFTGQSLKGPDGSVAFLKLGDSAVERPAPSQAEMQAAIERARTAAAAGNGGAQRVALQPGAPVSAAGRAQGIAFDYGKGRVVVLGEAAMLSAQLAPDGRPFGMNRQGIDNLQLALNILHWLSRALG